MTTDSALSTDDAFSGVAAGAGSCVIDAFSGSAISAFWTTFFLGAFGACGGRGDKEGENDESQNEEGGRETDHGTEVWEESERDCSVMWWMEIWDDAMGER